jgi:hypothetical protein
VLRLTEIVVALSHPVLVARSISLPTHAALELVLGLAPAGPDSLPLSTHQAFDLAMIAALAGGGVGLGIAGDPAAGLLLAVVGCLQLTLLTLTRWARG